MKLPVSIRWRLRTLHRMCLTVKCLFVGHYWQVIAHGHRTRHAPRLEVAVCMTCGQAAVRGNQ